MENAVEIVQTGDQSVVQHREPFDGNCSNAQQNEIKIVEMNKVEESISEEEFDLQYASSLDSETDSFSEIPQKFARTSKFINKNNSTKLGFGYRPKNEEQEKSTTNIENISEQDSDGSQEKSDQNDDSVLSLTTAPQRQSSRVANLKMLNSMTERVRSKSMTTVDQKASKSMPEKKGKATSRKRSRPSVRDRSRPSARSRSRSKSAKARKSSKSTKSAPIKKRATKRRSSKK